MARAGVATRREKKNNLELKGRTESAIWGGSHTILIIDLPLKLEIKEDHVSFEIVPIVAHFIIN